MGSRAWLLVLILGCVLLGGCSERVDSARDAVQAEQALASFLGLLSEGDYQEAAALYTGPLEALQIWNPEIDPQDVAALIGYGCDQHLIQCLPVRSITLAESSASGERTFHVEFELADGSAFVLGPCCGATATEMPPQSIFPFRVERKADGGFGVYDLPPYVP